MIRGTVFAKCSGSGNDFVMLDGRTIRAADWTPERIAATCDRHHGVGADGLVILTPEPDGAVRMDYHNADGSRASMCGNAALCSVRLAAWLEMARPAHVVLRTDIGLVPGRCLGTGWLAEVELPDAQAGRPVPGIAGAAGERGIWLSQAGVPHLVVAVDDLTTVDVDTRGRQLRHHPALGPEGANVNFVQVLPTADPAEATLAVRTYERGVERETLACGTGCIGTAVTAAATGLAPLPARLRTAGGRILSVSADLDEAGRARRVSLAGEGRLVFRGVLE